MAEHFGREAAEVLVWMLLDPVLQQPLPTEYQGYEMEILEPFQDELITARGELFNISWQHQAPRYFPPPARKWGEDDDDSVVRYARGPQQELGRARLPR